MADNVPTHVMRASRPRAFDAPANTDTARKVSRSRPGVGLLQPPFDHPSNVDNSSNLSSTYCKSHVYTLTFQSRTLTSFPDKTDLKPLAPPPQAYQLPGPTRTVS